MRKLPLVRGIIATIFLLITIGISTTMAQSVEEQGIMSAAISSAIVVAALGLSVFEGGEAILAIPVAFVTALIVLVAGGSLVSGYGIAVLAAPYIDGYSLFVAVIAIAISLALVLITHIHNVIEEKIGKKEIIPTISMAAINFGIFYWVPGLISYLL